MPEEGWPLLHVHEQAERALEGAVKVAGQVVMGEATKFNSRSALGSTKLLSSHS